MNYAIIVAGGRGQRFSENIKKQFFKINNKTILELTIEKFNNHPQIDNLVIVLPEEELQQCEYLTDKFKKIFSLTKGGLTRFESVFNGIKTVENIYNKEYDKILIHDAVRPLVSDKLISNVLECLNDFNCIVPGVKLADNVKKVDFLNIVTSNIDRDKLFAIQTPQGVRGDVVEIYKKAKDINFEFRDDASVFEFYGYDVKVIEGDKFNIKITTKEDISFLKFFTGEKMKIRSGLGFDVHRFGENRKLILGGVKIPFDKGLEGHSDADVLIHALIDALLGACAKGDIGEHFPDSNIKYKDINSFKLLKDVYEYFIKDKFFISSIDITLICEKPKIKDYKDLMKDNISKCLEIKKDFINIKATTTEKLGFTGREEGVACYALVNLIES